MNKPSPLSSFKKNLKKAVIRLKNKRIIIACGGFSEEKETSLESGNAVYKELKKNGFNSVKIDPSKENITPLLDRKTDIVFNCLHGSFGESGHLPGILDYLKVPYTFSGLYTSAITMDKVFFKSFLKKFHLKCPLDNVDKSFQKINRSFFIHKKIRGGSSMGMALSKSKTPKKDYFIEEFIEGSFVTIGVLECRGRYTPLGVVAFKEKERDFYDEIAKYHGLYKYCKYRGKNRKKIEEYAILVSRYLSIKGCARIDFIEKDNEVFILEVNSIPGIYPESNLLFSAKLSDLSFYELIIWILDNAAYQDLN